VYVLAADSILGIENGRLQLRRQSAARRERKPIDIFFGALARDRGELAVGIVLSGGDSDGTLGLKAIKERGGLTIAQVADGFGPGYRDMPDSAIASGFVDLAVPADQMGAKVIEFAHGPEQLRNLVDAAEEDAATRRWSR
jgi:two-component system CheB/CheR fusion protein